MSLTAIQAKELGRLVATARARKKISTRALAAQLGISYAWITRLEAGDFLEPSAVPLAKLAAALDIDPARFDRLTHGAVQAGLPEPRVYFRSKLALTLDETDRVMQYIERLRRAA